MLCQRLPDGDRVDVFKSVLFRCGVEPILLDELGNPALYLGPGQHLSFRAFRANRKRSLAVAAVKLMGQPCGGVFFPPMLLHVTDNGVFTFDFSVPVLDSFVDVIVRERTQQLVELGIGLVDDFPMKALTELRRVGIEAEQLHVSRPQDSTADGGITLDHGIFIVTVTACVSVSGVLGNSLQHDGLVLLMQFPEGQFCRLCLMAGSFRLRLFLGKRKSRGCFHILCFIYDSDLFCFGEEETQL